MGKCNTTVSLSCERCNHGSVILPGRDRANVHLGVNTVNSMEDNVTDMPTLLSSLNDNIHEIVKKDGTSGILGSS